MSPGAEDYSWPGEFATLSRVFAGVRPTSEFRVRSGNEERDFVIAGRDDYEAVLRREGQLLEFEALADRPELVAAAQAHWHSSGANGCRFAMYLSENRARFGWESWVMGDHGDASSYASAIDERVRARLEPAEIDVLSIILPRVETHSELGDIVEALGGRENWRVSDQGLEADPQHGSLQLLGLSLAIDLEHWSEVLGFGPAAPLAHTRRAPFTELAIRAKPPKRPRTHNHRAYMADIDADLDRETTATWWRETERRRAERLGDQHDARGKARVTTVVSRPTGA